MGNVIKVNRSNRIISKSMKAKDKANEEVILGARDLGKQIEKTIPTYKVLLQQIEEFRFTADKVNKEGKNKVRQDYVNTLGIFGQRGTGKSSVLYTLQSDLSEKEDQPRRNILLKLIEPDKFGENTKIIGSIVGLLVEQAHKLLEQMKNQNGLGLKCKPLNANHDLGEYYNLGVFKPNNPLKQHVDKMIEYHLYTENRYRDILNQHFEDFATHVRKSERLLIPDIEFQKAFYKLVEEVIKVQTAINKGIGSDAEVSEVLIFIFIDDIDLNTSKTRELIDGLLKCTNHPNIVTVLSGDYDILYESMTLALLADEPLSKLGMKVYDSLGLMKKRDIKLNNNVALTIMERKTGLAHEYLKKIIPPAGRHQLVKWTATTIPYFSFGDIRLVDQLAELMEEQSVFGYKDKLNLENPRLVPITSSYTIFDERPRGLVNAYYHLVQLLKVLELSKELERKEEKFRFVKMFIDTLVLSNQRLLPYQQLVFETFLIWGMDGKSTFIDYSVLIDPKDIPDFELLILVEIVKHHLPEVRYNHDNFEEVKNNNFNKLLLSDSDRSEKEKFLKTTYMYPIYQMMRGFVSSIDIKAALLLFEFLSQHTFDSYYYPYYGAINQQEKDKFAVQQISKLIRQYPEILSQLYNKAKIKRIAEANQAINVLDNLCRAGIEFEKTEKIFNLVLKPIDAKYYAKDFNEKTNNNIQVVRDLFINTLTSLRLEISRLDSYSSISGVDSKVLVIQKDDFNTLTKILHKLNQAVSENKKIKVPELIFNAIETDIQKLGIKLFDKIGNDTIISIPLEKDLNNTLRYFRKNYDGSGSTNYYNCKITISKILPEGTNEISLIDYFTIVDSLRDLSTNSRVWYGQLEASALLTFLKNEAFIRFDVSKNEGNEFFRGNEKAVLEEYYKYVSSTQEFQEDVQYDEDKKFVKQQLDYAYNKIKTDTQANLNDFDLGLAFLEQTEQEGESNA